MYSSINGNSNTTKGLYDGEIDSQTSRMLKGTIVRWMGVFAHDELPSEEKLLRAQMQDGNLPIALVFNNQLANEHGHHWLAIFGVSSAAKGGVDAAAQNDGGGLHIKLNFVLLCLAFSSIFIVFEFQEYSALFTSSVSNAKLCSVWSFLPVFYIYSLSRLLVFCYNLLFHIPQCASSQAL